MTKHVLVTGARGIVGTAIWERLADRDEYRFSALDQEDSEAMDVYVGDITRYEDIRPAFDGVDAVLHLAGYPRTDGTFAEVLENNIVGTYNVLECALDADVEQFIFASSNHAVGMYEAAAAPEIYDPAHDLVVDHTAPHRPDSHYGASKCYGEDLGRFYVERDGAPDRFYALRFGAIQTPEYDHPYGYAEIGVDDGDWTRDCPEYEAQVVRMKAIWQSRRDAAHMVECCLQDTDATFDVFYGVSDNDRRWFDIQHAADVLGYDPQDNAEEWTGPP